MSIIKKLRFKDGTVSILNLPESCKGIFQDIDYTGKVPTKSIEQVLLFAVDQKSLDKAFKQIQGKLAEEALLWIAYPKKSGAIKSDITRDNGWNVVFAAGYDPVMQIAVDEDWSALRFRKSEAIGEKLRDVPMKDRVVEGIDFVNRKVNLPEDIKASIEPYTELLSYFNMLSFSHQKEYVTYIVEAKKQETRARRISKMIDQLTEQVKMKK